MNPRIVGRREVVLAAAGALLAGCSRQDKFPRPLIRFSRVPQADPGSGSENDVIGGTVVNARPGQRIVLYAKSNSWWVQPSEDAPFTKLRGKSRWINATRLGSEYAALLVDPGYVPPARFDVLPEATGLVKAVASVKGQASPPSPALEFSGYKWRIRTAPSNRGGTNNIYERANASTDASGALHLRISKSSGKWSCAEVSLTRNLGYGTYQFSVRDTSRLDPAAVFGMFTWDYSAAEEHYGELDIEISRWGNPDNKNSQYLIQPYNVPTNVVRFGTPAGPVVYSFEWRPERLSFKSTQPSGKLIAAHDFTSSVPRPRLESVRMNLYVFNEGRVRMKNGAEVVIDKFSYLP